MKKISLFIISLLLLPLCVFAANEKILTLDAESEGLTIKYTGTTEKGSHAVMCKLYMDETEIDLLSSAVDENKFEGSFVVNAEGTYEVRCANYEGGDIKTASVEVKNEITVTPTANEENPKTYDAGIKTSVIVLSISAVAILGIGLYFKKKEINN